MYECNGGLRLGGSPPALPRAVPVQCRGPGPRGNPGVRGCIQPVGAVSRVERLLRECAEFQPADSQPGGLAALSG